MEKERKLQIILAIIIMFLLIIGAFRIWNYESVGVYWNLFYPLIETNESIYK